MLGRVRSRKPHPDMAGEVEVLPLRQGGLPFGWGWQKLRWWPNRSYGGIAYHGGLDCSFESLELINYHWVNNFIFIFITWLTFIHTYVLLSLGALGVILEALAAGNVRPARFRGVTAVGNDPSYSAAGSNPENGGREWPVLQRLGFESWKAAAGNVPSCRACGSKSAIRRSGRAYLCAEASQPHIAFSRRPAPSCLSRRFGLGVLGLVPATLANLDSVL